MTLIKLDLHVPLVGLDNNPVPDTDLGKALAIQLVAPAAGDILRHFDWAQALYKGEAIEVSGSDFEYLRRFVETIQTLSILAKKRILDAMDEAKSPTVCDSSLSVVPPAQAPI